MAISFSYNFGFVTRSKTVELDYPVQSTTTSSDVVVTVYPRWYRYIVVDWQVPADWGNCTFNVYFAHREAGELIRLNKVPISGNSLVDYTTQEYSEFRDGFYVVEVFNPTTNTFVRSKPTTWMNKQRRWVEIRSDEVQRRELILLSKFTGVKSYVFRRKTYGQRCSVCWDSRSETVTRDNCTVCFGTSFEGGYFPPQPVFVQFDATPNQVQHTYFGRSEPNVIGAWTISLPQISSDDIIMRTGDWNVYRVAGVQTTELQANPVRQIMQLAQLSRKDVENQLLTSAIPEFPAEYIQAQPEVVVNRQPSSGGVDPNPVPYVKYLI